MCPPAGDRGFGKLEIRVRLYRLTVETFLVCVAGAACLSGQSSGSNQRVAPALEAGDNSSDAKLPAEGGSVIPSNAAEYAGNSECKTCHPTIWASFYKNPHFKSLAAGKAPPELTACEGCHGPAKAHIAAGGGRNTIVNAFTIKLFACRCSGLSP